MSSSMKRKKAVAVGKSPLQLKKMKKQHSAMRTSNRTSPISEKFAVVKPILVIFPGATGSLSNSMEEFCYLH